MSDAVASGPPAPRMLRSLNNAIADPVSVCVTVSPLLAPRTASEPLEVDAFADLYDRHAGGVFRTAHQILRDRAQAEDVTQEVFLAFWRRPGSFDRSRGALGAYLRVMARSRALDALRAAGAARRAHERLEHAAAVPHERVADEPDIAVGAAAERSELRAAVAGLPAPQREALALSYWGELSTSEIAARFELPHGTVKSRVRLGLRKLRERVDDDRLVA
jgi:RNA polymerase sigma-70 factor (ECF subfamily)